jgi:hypothetical protein
MKINLKRIILTSTIAIFISCTGIAQKTGLNIGDKAPELSYENPKGEILTTRITEGMTEYSYKGQVGYGMSEYLDQIVNDKPLGP